MKMAKMKYKKNMQTYFHLQHSRRLISRSQRHVYAYTNFRADNLYLLFIIIIIIIITNHHHHH
jgi:hypothetical protein